MPPGSQLTYLLDFMWCPGPDLNRHDLNGRGILSSLHYGTTQDNPPKHKSNALPS